MTNIIYDLGEIYANKKIDGLEPRGFLDKINVDEKRLLKLLIKLGTEDSAIDAFGHWLEYSVGVQHGGRMLEGLTYQEELYLLYMEQEWKKRAETLRDFGPWSYELAEVILNFYQESDFWEAVDAEKIKITLEMENEANERNKHNNDKSYHASSYEKLKKTIKEIEKDPKSLEGYKVVPEEIKSFWPDG